MHQLYPNFRHRQLNLTDNNKLSGKRLGDFAGLMQVADYSAACFIFILFYIGGYKNASPFR